MFTIMKFSLLVVASLLASTAAFTSPSTPLNNRLGPLFHAPKNAPKHDVGGENAMTSLSPDQQERVKAYMEHQNNVPTPGFPVDVRSLIQYNHGFAVMSTFSKV
jgi:hypothetical protein